jgi:hypothetical protein
MLVNCVASADLFHTATGISFADIAVDGYRETWPIRSTYFRAWLRRQHYQATGDALSPDVIRVTVDHLEARAQFDAPERTINGLGMHAGGSDEPASVPQGEAAGKGDSLEDAIIRLERLERYERRALSRRKRAIRCIMKIASES